MKIEVNKPEQIIHGLGLQNMGRVQRFFDVTVVKGMEPYVPFKQGALRGSGKLYTQYGSGKVYYNTPYAKKQFYEGRIAGTKARAKRQGRQWSKRYWADKKAKVIGQVQKYVDRV